jgi:A/G-specific adenine glycosylase
MELGATVCTPRNPRCSVCPVADACAARAAGTQHQRPAPKRAAPLPHEDTAVAVVEHEGRLLLVRRPASGRLGGMWAFPCAVRAADETAAAGAERAAREGVGLQVRAGTPVGVVAHAFTHVRATYHAIRCRVLSGTPEALRYDAVEWVTADELARYALPVAQRRIAALALAQR